jgi:hypothetical protein
MISELEPPTRNLSGTLAEASDDPLPSKLKEPLVFYGVPERAGGSNRRRPAWEAIVTSRVPVRRRR